MISLLIGLVIVGFLLWLVNTYIPMDAKFKQLINVLAILFVIVWVIRAIAPDVFPY
jgi:hypothetical protein